MDFFTKPSIYTDKTDANNCKQYKVLCNLAKGRYADVQKVELITNQEDSDLNPETKDDTDDNANDTNTNNTAQQSEQTEKREPKIPTKDNIYALKSQQIFAKDEIKNRLQREIDIMQTLKSNNKNNNTNVIRMITHFTDSNYLLFLLPFFDSNLQNLLETAPLKLSQIRNIIHQICNGLSFIHGLNIIHRDLKPNNILVSSHTQQITIADFGSARDITSILSEEKHSENEENKSVPNTCTNDEIPGFDSPKWDGFDTDTNCKLSPQIYVVMYRAPELLLGERSYRFAIDIWAMACIMAQMCREKGQLLFDESHDIPLFLQQISILGGPKGEELTGIGLFSKFFQMESKEHIPMNKIVDGLDENGYDLLARMFALDFKKRITAKDALEHKFFENVGK